MTNKFSFEAQLDKERTQSKLLNPLQVRMNDIIDNSKSIFFDDEVNVGHESAPSDL